MVVHHALGVQGVVDRPVLHLQIHGVLNIVLPCGVAVLHGPAHHALDNPVLAELVHALDQGLDGGSVPDDGGLVGAVDDLVELVGDDNGGEPLLLKLHQQVQKHLGVLVVQRRGGLVQNQELHVLGEGLGDLHQLLLAGADVLDQSLGGLPQAHLAHVALRLAVGLVPVDVAGLVPDLVAQEHVLPDGEQGNEGQLLVDDDDAKGLAVLLIFELAQLALVVDLAGVAARRVGPREHIHQGGLASPVFADEGVNLAGLHLKIYVVQRLDARKFLGDGSHFQYGICQTVFLLSAFFLQEKGPKRTVSPLPGAQGRIERPSSGPWVQLLRVGHRTCGGIGEWTGRMPRPPVLLLAGNLVRCVIG